MASTRTGSRRSVGLRDIAEELNLSVSMVSKVLNGRMGTSGGLPETVRAIHAKAAELGYRKNLQAEALRTGRMNVIAVCVHHHGVVGSLIVEAMVEGIAREATDHHQRLVLHYYKTLEELQTIWSECRRNAVDGVILGGVPHVDWLQQVNANTEQGLPVVTILSSESATDCTNIGMSEAEICRRTTSHLLDRGCRRIAHFYVQSNDHLFMNNRKAMADHRYEGYCQALAERGIPLLDELVIRTGHFHYEFGIKATQQLLASGVKFDGIVTQSDHQAAAALNVLVRNGVRVPQDVKLIGVDNSPFCDMASVSLSSVSQEFEARGRLAVEALMKKIDGEIVSSMVVDPVLHPRESTSV